MTTGAAALRVLHVHSGNLFGGVERMLEALASPPAMSALCSEFALCFSGRLHDTLQAAGARVTLLGPVQMRRPDRLWRARRALRTMLQEDAPGAVMVHSSWSQAAFAGSVRQAGVPLVRWLHAPDPGPAWLEWWASRCRPSAVFHNSRYTQAAAPAGDATHAVVYPPIRAEAAARGSRNEVRTELGVAGGTVVIAIAARLEPWKGHLPLLDAFGSMAAAGSELWVIGGVQRPSEGGYLESLQRRAAQRGITGRVRFLGEREDVARVLPAADIYCQPNTGPEPFGISFVEALAAGLPVVTTRLGAAAEIVDDSCGRLTTPGDAAELTATLATLVADAGLRQRLGRAAVERAARFCDLSAATARLAQAIRSVVELPVPS